MRVRGPRTADPDVQGVGTCVFCRRQRVEPAWRPFCSERCKLQDLARWADGAYRVTGEPLPPPEDNDDTGQQ